MDGDLIKIKNQRDHNDIRYGTFSGDTLSGESDEVSPNKIIIICLNDLFLS